MSEAMRRLNAKVDVIGHSGVQPWSAGEVFPFVIVRTDREMPGADWFSTWQGINGPHGQATAEFYSYDACYDACRAVLDLLADNKARAGAFLVSRSRHAGTVLDGVAFNRPAPGSLADKLEREALPPVDVLLGRGAREEFYAAAEADSVAEDGITTWHKAQAGHVRDLERRVQSPTGAVLGDGLVESEVQS